MRLTLSAFGIVYTKNNIWEDITNEKDEDDFICRNRCGSDRRGNGDDVATPALSDDKPAIEVITHAGAGGGTDVNSRMMMIRTRRHLKQDMVVVNKRGGGGAAAMNYFKTHVQLMATP